MSLVVGFEVRGTAGIAPWAKAKSGLGYIDLSSWAVKRLVYIEGVGRRRRRRVAPVSGAIIVVCAGLFTHRL